MNNTTQSLPTIAVVLAGGAGQRVGLPVPKQLVKIAGKSILEHTIQVFQEAPEIDEILVFMHPDYVDAAQGIVARASLTKVTGVHAGGASRSETTRRAISGLTVVRPPGTDVNVLFHDAVRPLLSRRVIADCVEALREHRAVDVAIPSSDSVVITEEREEKGEFVRSVPQREALRRGQTPQGFRLSVIRAAYEMAARDPGFVATDDCTVVLKYLPEVPVYVVRGDEHNMKVTYPVDIFIADKLFQLASRLPPERMSKDAYACALRDKVLVIFGASCGIGAEIANLARQFGAVVHAFSRSATDTYVEKATCVERALAQAHAESGRIHFVVNTAGRLSTGDLACMDEDAIAHATAVNYLAPVHIARASHRYLAESGGQLLLFTSSSYTRGRAGYSLYSSAKAATVNLTQALAEEWAADDIRVNCVNPERTRTPMRLNAFGVEPADSLLTSHEVARTSVDILLSDVTGQVVDVRRQDPMAPSSSPDSAWFSESAEPLT